MKYQNVKIWAFFDYKNEFYMRNVCDTIYARKCSNFSHKQKKKKLNTQYESRSSLSSLLNKKKAKKNKQQIQV